MNTDIGTSAGLGVYRELVNRESSGNTNWHINYGIDAQLKAASGQADPQKLITVNGLEAAVSLPMPLAVQLFALQHERRKLDKEGKVLEEKIQPFLSKLPVSAASYEIWGERAYTQRPNSQRSERPASAATWSLKGAPHSRGPANQLHLPDSKRPGTSIGAIWREPVGPAHSRVRPQSAFR